MRLLLEITSFWLVASAAEVKSGPVTFTKDVAPVLQAKCQSCHRVGSMAPMPLMTYAETRPWAKAIREKVLTRDMPPWHVDKTVGIQKFANDFSLTDSELNTLVRWVDEGAVQGEPKDMPPPKAFPSASGWQLAGVFGREPDLVLKSEPYTMPAKGQDVWYKPLTPIPLTEPRWVRAVEIRPATPAGRRITHHALAFLQQEESAETFGSAGPVDGARGGLLMEWAVNKNYDLYRENTGKLVLPGARIWWELHYHAVGEAIRDHVELAVYLYPKGEQPKYRTYLTPIHAAGLSNGMRMLDIPPNSVTQVQGFFPLKAPARLENYQPHMHLRGKAMTLSAILPDGTKQTLSHVDRFTFNWMTNYIFDSDAAPVLPKGTLLQVTAWHDNTNANKNNPDPDQWVGWGDRTVDEMAHAWVNITYLTEDDYREWAQRRK